MSLVTHCQQEGLIYLQEAAHVYTCEAGVIVIIAFFHLQKHPRQ